MRNTNKGESMEEYVMRNGVKSCTEVKEDENGEKTRISCHEVVSYFYEGGFCTVTGAKPD